ncbi:Ty3/Gypsy family RNase HI domain-containing protein, partial [Streptomyces sp. IBSBF 2390]|uniref:Ty3/Gypsy family RNase HI domain-containing protein n=1 Tax=Streptomyces sp. IBSBF 2390 TaxID=2903533 RepID=UPI002FDBD2D7
MSFYSKKLTKAQSNYSTYDRELTAIFQAIKFFRYFLDGRSFTVFTDHKPLTFAFRQNLEKASPRQQRQLDFISQFTTDIQHVTGDSNEVADWLSRIASIQTTEIDFEKMSVEQTKDTELQELIRDPQRTSLQFSRWFYTKFL